MGIRCPIRGAAAAAAVLVMAAPATGAFDPRLLDQQLRSEPGLGSVVIARHDRIIFEHYYNGDSASARLDVFSITKSVVSTLVGIALHNGRIRSLDERLSDFFPREVRAAPDKRVRDITLRELLSMRSGYRNIAQLASDDWVRTLVDRELAAAPGTSWAYDNGSYHLLSAVLTKTTGLTAEAYARRVLFGPLGIRKASWLDDGQGHSLGSGGLRLAARDLLRLGELYLADGRWRGRQIVPRWYVHAVTRVETRVSHGVGYGLGWWTLSPPSGFAATGSGGQAIVVFPGWTLVIVITGTDVRSRVLNRLILPALGIR